MADQSSFNTKRGIKNSAFTANIAVEVESDWRFIVRKLDGDPTKTSHSMLHKDLNLSKKSERWVPKLLNDEMKNERVRTSEEFLAMARPHFLSMLDNIAASDSHWCPSIHMRRSSGPNSGWRRASLGPSRPKSTPPAAGRTLTQKTLKKEWKRRVRTLSVAEFSAADRWWQVLLEVHEDLGRLCQKKLKIRNALT